MLIEHSFPGLLHLHLKNPTQFLSLLFIQEPNAIFNRLERSIGNLASKVNLQGEAAEMLYMYSWYLGSLWSVPQK